MAYAQVADPVGSIREPVGFSLKNHWVLPVSNGFWCVRVETELVVIQESSGEFRLLLCFAPSNHGTWFKRTLRLVSRTAAALPRSSNVCGTAHHGRLHFDAHTEEEKTNEVPTGLAFGNPFRFVNVHDSVIWALVMACSSVSTEEGLKRSAADFGINLPPRRPGLSHKREMARRFTAWKQAKDVKLNIDAVAKAHGEPATVLPADWTPAASYSESFDEQPADGMLRAEPSAHGVSFAEEQAQDKLELETARQDGVYLDAKLTIQTKPPGRQHHAERPSKPFAQLRQPGRALHADQAEETFDKFPETLLNKKNFNLSQVDGVEPTFLELDDHHNGKAPFF